MLLIEPARRQEFDRLATLLKGMDHPVDEAWLFKAANEGSCLVARHAVSDRVLGFALARREPCCQAHLLALAVDPAHRRDGVGSALLRAVEEDMMLSGAMELHLEVRSDDARARWFYQRHGFRPEGVQSHAYPDGADAVCLTRPL